MPGGRQWRSGSTDNFDPDIGKRSYPARVDPKLGNSRLRRIRTIKMIEGCLVPEAPQKDRNGQRKRLNGSGLTKHRSDNHVPAVMQPRARR